jgi:hypothetical protein
MAVDLWFMIPCSLVVMCQLCGRISILPVDLQTTHCRNQEDHNVFPREKLGLTFPFWLETGSRTCLRNFVTCEFLSRHNTPELNGSESGVHVLMKRFLKH